MALRPEPGKGLWGSCSSWLWSGTGLPGPRGLLSWWRVQSCSLQRKQPDEHQQQKTKQTTHGELRREVVWEGSGCS